MAHRIAHRSDDIPDLIQVGMVALWRDHERSKKQHIVVRKPWALARTVIQRAMWNFYIPGAKPNSNGRVLDTAVSLDAGISVDHLGEAVFAFAYDTDHADAQGRAEKHRMPSTDLDGYIGGEAERFHLEEFFRLLEARHGALARKVAENLLYPSDPLACQRILSEVRRKEQARSTSRKRKNRLPRGVEREIRLSHRLIRQALGLSHAEWSKQLAVVREFAGFWLTQ